MSEEAAEYGEKRTKICPFYDRDPLFVECVEERCAFWYDGACTYVQIAQRLKRLSRPKAVPGL